MRVYYSPEYVGSTYAFETTRKAKWVADSLLAAPIPGVELAEPPPLSWEQLVQVHDPEYVRAVQTGNPRPLAESQGFQWDPGLWRMVLSSNGGVVAACLDALPRGVSGSLSSGLHHARRGHGAGFCTFNGLVVAAQESLAAGAESVLILDLDAHCGGGTVSLIAFQPRIWQFDLAVNSFDFYTPPQAARERIQLRLVTQAQDYLPELQKGLEELAQLQLTFSLCLYNAGMDPFEGCPTGGLRGITRDILATRERLVFDWCREHTKSCAFVLAGGYIGWGLSVEELVDLHRLTVAAASALAAEWSQ